jgi:F-type H+-transporting ATPase subunit gamma
MPSLRQIRRRIRSVQNTAKITRAMEMVAAANSPPGSALQTRPYTEKMLELLGHLAAQQPEGDEVPELLQRRPAQTVGFVHITPDRGLSGALNGNVNRSIGTAILREERATQVVAVGRKGRDFLVRTRQRLVAEFSDLGDRPGILEVSPIAHLIIEEYERGEVDLVYLSYPRFVSTTTQRPVIEQLLPVQPQRWEGAAQAGYIYEPDPRAVLTDLLPRFVEMQIYHAVLETIASEQSARMVAMHNATENASDLIRELTLIYNKARQESITKELLDITGGTVALTG